MKIIAILLMPALVVASFHASSAPPATTPTAPRPTPVTVAAASPGTREATISISEFMFSPLALTVTAGTTVHWKNLDAEPHTVRGVDGSFRSDPLDQNDSFAFKFEQPGTYRYVCSIHPRMLGTIVVEAAAAAN